jgi:hypothetical protein
VLVVEVPVPLEMIILFKPVLKDVPSLTISSCANFLI